MTFGVLAEADPPRPEIIKSKKSHKKHKKLCFLWLFMAFYAFYDLRPGRIDLGQDTKSYKFLTMTRTLGTACMSAVFKIYRGTPNAPH